MFVAKILWKEKVSTIANRIAMKTYAWHATTSICKILRSTNRKKKMKTTNKIEVQMIGLMIKKKTSIEHFYIIIMNALIKRETFAISLRKKKR